MAIDKVNKVIILLPKEDSRWFLRKLYHLNIIHITDTFSQTDESFLQHFRRYPAIAYGDREKNIHKLNTILSVFKTFVRKKKSFLDGIFPTPLQVTHEELDQTLSRVNVESLYKECQGLYEKFGTLQKRGKQFKEEINKVSVFLPLSDEIMRMRNVKNVTFLFCQAPEVRWNRFTKDASACEFLTWQVVLKTKKEHSILFAYLNKDRDVALKILTTCNFKNIPLPALSCNVKEHVEKLVMEISRVNQERNLIYHRMLKLSEDWRSLEILLGYWENEQNKMAAQQRCAMSKRVFVLVGYIKTCDRYKLDTSLKTEFPSASVFYEEPLPDDQVPVSITLNRFARPAQLLINMFGLPNYFTFDPTPFIMISFLVLFGLCFGDVFYGLFLIAISAWMIRKHKKSEALSNFLRLFFYAGISTTICGAITGGWAGDLYNPLFLGKDNILLKLKERFSLLDPLSKPIIALLLTIGLGVLNQFYGITLRMYGELRRRHFVNALCDSLLWLILLPGFLILVLTVFLKLPLPLISAGKYMSIIGATGLVLTQGRNKKGIAGKIFTGIVSLYGIVGTYGCISFIGDILSYSRILALSLTTTIVGMSFNIVANLFKTDTYFGTILFLITLVSGHMFNFLMSILSAFVHPARLIFLELFGRFYEGGASRFQPYGFGNQRIHIIENDANNE